RGSFEDGCLQGFWNACKNVVVDEREPENVDVTLDCVLILSEDWICLAPLSGRAEIDALSGLRFRVPNLTLTSK
ncbi:hypothetical protein A2U01_0054006, partial [Trifolium medium]|nr:hypothetical protein [Trifolium medium]